MRFYLLLFIILGVLGAGSAWYLHAHAGSSAPRFETTAIDRGGIVAKVTATGTLSALVTVQVGSQVSGRIQELDADFNSEVKKDQVLARLDPLFFQASLDQARATLAVAEGNLAKARVQAVDADRQLARFEQLFAQKIVTQSDRDTAETAAATSHAEITVAQGNLDQAKAALKQAEVNLDYTTIRSPVDGVVISRAVDVGQTVAASLQAPIIFTIAGDLKQMQVDTSVAEGDVGKLTAQTPVSFTVDAYPGEEFRGTVRQVRNNAQTVQNVVTYDAVIDVKNPELKLKPGMTANVTFIYAEKDHALRLPNAALRYRPPPGLGEADRSGSADGAAPGAGMKSGEAKPAAAADGERKSGEPTGNGPHSHHGGGEGKASDERTHDPSSDRRTVWVLRDGKAERRRLRTGITDGSFTEVVEGELAEGELIITDNLAGGASAGASPFRRVF